MKKKPISVIAFVLALIVAISGSASLAGAADDQAQILTECGGNCDKAEVARIVGGKLG